MRARSLPIQRPERGFSMIELLVVAFIMGVGLLGLASLQMMSIRAGGTSTRLSDAVRVGEMLMEAASAEGTQSLLGLKYGGGGAAAPVMLSIAAPQNFYYGYDTTVTGGLAVGGLKQLPDATGAIFTANVSRQTTFGSVGFGATSLFTVQVTFTELLGSTSVTRTVRNAREVAHA